MMTISDLVVFARYSHGHKKLVSICAQDWDWFNGRNFCRDRCMDLVSFDLPGEYAMFKEIMLKGGFRAQFFCLFSFSNFGIKHFQTMSVLFTPVVENATSRTKDAMEHIFRYI